MKYRKWIVGLIVALAVAVIAVAVWSTRPRQLGPAEVVELVRFDAADAPDAPVDRLRVVVVDAEFGAQFDPASPRWPGPATWADLIDTLAHEISLLHPDVLVVFDVTTEQDRDDHVSAAKAIAIEADLTYRLANTTWSAHYAAWPAWPPSAQAGPIDAGHVIYTRLPLTLVDGDVGAPQGDLAQRTWGPRSGYTHARLAIGGGAHVDIRVLDGIGDGADTVEPNVLVATRPPLDGALTDDDGRVGLVYGSAFSVLRPMTHSRLNGSVRGTILYAELAVDVAAPADGSGDPAPSAPVTP